MRYWLARTSVASDFLAALVVLGVVLVLYRRRCFDRLAAVIPVALLAVALAVMLYREGLRLWPYHGRSDVFTLLQSADAVVVLSFMVGIILTATAAFSPAGLGCKRLPFWRRGVVERGTTGNYGAADWMPIADARRRLPEKGGIVVGEAYRVDQGATPAVEFHAGRKRGRISKRRDAMRLPKLAPFAPSQSKKNRAVSAN